VPNAIRHISSRCMPLHRDHVDTDQIIAARFLKVTSKIGLGQHAFSDFRFQEDGSPNLEFVMNQPRFAHARILVAGHNFGCGSSREHAPWALVDYGFEAIIASSFADIFRNNALKNGLLTIELPEAVVSELRHACDANPHLNVDVDVEAQTVTIEGMGIHTFPLNTFWKQCLLEGLDQVGYTLRFEEHIKAHERRAMLFPVAAPVA
jgi:3-isopropylmalate/(R)-2-methylmalate dehydratase small subunit